MGTFETIKHTPIAGILNITIVIIYISVSLMHGHSVRACTHTNTLWYRLFQTHLHLSSGAFKKHFFQNEVLQEIHHKNGKWDAVVSTITPLVLTTKKHIINI